MSVSTAPVDTPLRQAWLRFRRTSLGPITVVPLPMTVWLFERGLVGLVGFLGRRGSMIS